MKNPLQEHPHLFLTNKFKVKHPDWGGTFNLGVKSEFVQECVGNLGVSFEDCTLIARPISDMSDEEIREVYDSPNYTQDDCEQMREFLITRAGSGNMKLSIALKLADRGVYPFSQSHFNDGTVTQP